MIYKTTETISCDNFVWLWNSDLILAVLL